MPMPALKPFRRKIWMKNSPKACAWLWSQGFRASAQRAGSQPLGAAGLTPPLWPLLRPSMRSAVIFIPMSMGSIPPTRAYRARHANSTKSLLKRCSSWPLWAQKFCKPALSNWPCGSMCASGCLAHSKTHQIQQAHWSVPRRKSWNQMS